VAQILNNIAQPRDASGQVATHAETLSSYGRIIFATRLTAA
jgi:hypothetical protein